MAHSWLVMEQPNTRHVKEAPLGYSWSMLFFGVFVPVVRSDWKWAFVSFALAIATLGLSWLILPFLYNAIYAKGLIGEGFKAKAIRGQVPTIEMAQPQVGMEIPIMYIEEPKKKRAIPKAKASEK